MKFGLLSKLWLALSILVSGIAALNMGLMRDEQASPLLVTPKQPLPTQTLIPAFSAMNNVIEKKQAFFDFIRPNVINANRDIALQRQYLLDLQASVNDQTPPPVRYLALLKEYNMDTTAFDEATLNQLLVRVDILPIELIMVQAANESGWGTSRFARLGLNFFGQWCFKKGCGLVPNSRNVDAVHEVRVFNSVEESIASYLKNINTHAAYRHLREVRATLRDSNQPLSATQLAPGLSSYSERGDDYILELLQMIKHNKAYF